MSTTLIAIFKHEKDESTEQDSLDLNLYQTYRLLGDIMKLPCVKSLSIILLTAKVFKKINKNIRFIKCIHYINLSNNIYNIN